MSVRRVHHHLLLRLEHPARRRAVQRYDDVAPEPFVDPYRVGELQRLAAAVREQQRHAIALHELRRNLHDLAAGGFHRGPGEHVLAELIQPGKQLRPPLQDDVGPLHLQLGFPQADHGSDPQSEFAGPNRFDEVLVSPGHEPGGQVLLFRLGTDDDDGDPGCAGVLTESAGGLEPVHDRHHDVHDDDVWSNRTGGVNRLLTIRGLDGREPFSLQQPLAQPPVRGTIVHEQNSRFPVRVHPLLLGRRRPHILSGAHDGLLSFRSGLCGASPGTPQVLLPLVLDTTDLDALRQPVSKYRLCSAAR